jgi:capsular exopolysaccharide synthesis family protein
MRSHSKRRGAVALIDHPLTAAQDTGASLSAGDLLQMFLRNKYFVMSCILVCAIAAAVYLSIATPIYEASASLRIDPSRASSLGLSDLLKEAGGYGSDALLTEIAILKSDIVAISVLDSLSDKDFLEYTGVSKKSLGLSRTATALSPQQDKLLTRFKKQLNVKQVEGTQLVAIGFRDPHPRVAAVIVNQVVTSYLKQSFDSRYGSVSQVSDWLSTEMGTLKDRAAEAQRRLAAFQEKNNILGTDASNNTTIDRLRLLNNRLAEAQSERIVKEAQMRAAMSESPAVLASLYPDASLNSLQAEQGSLYAQYAQQSTKFGPNYPPLIELKKQMQKIDSELTRSVETAKSRIKEEYNASEKAEVMLQREYDGQTAKAYTLNRQQAEYAVLQAEGSSSRELYDTLQYKLQQAGVVAGLNGVNTMLVDVARTPLHPVEPRKMVILGFGLGIGIFVGVGASFFKEAISDKVQNGEQLERVAGYPLLAMIPHLSPKQMLEKNGPVSQPRLPATSLVAYVDPKSRGAEAYRTLRNSFLLSSLDHKSKTVLITSTLAGEGKSSTTVNYAIVLAQKGARVLVLDADLRRPTLHTKFGVENGPGLANLLLEHTVEQPFMNPLPELDNLFLLTAGRQIPLPSEALSSVRFFALLKGWEKQFDYILIDSTPLLVVSDSLALASVADSVILVTLYNSTPMKAISRARDMLTRIDANVAGVIINDFPVRHANYGGNDYGYYS